MIDKLELRVPFRTPYSPEFQSLRREIRHTAADPFRPSKLYIATGDLRPFGYPFILHSEARYGDHNHKLEFIDSAQLSYPQMARHVGRVFVCDVNGLGVMRLDAAADVPGVSVPWFHDHARIQWKRLASDHSKIVRYGKRDLETLTYGARPNCFRIYNKIAESKAQYAKLLRKSEAGLGSFEALFGYPESGVLLTRVERQIGGDRIPEQINTFGRLIALPDFNPFTPLHLAGTGDTESNVDVDEVGFEHYAVGTFLQSMIARNGLHRTRSWLNQHANRNGARLLERYSRFIPCQGEGTTDEKLLEIYRVTVTRQLAEREMVA
jgi:hypothetical protein